VPSFAARNRAPSLIAEPARHKEGSHRGDPAPGSLRARSMGQFWAKCSYEPRV